jgi:hypothetical protein
MLPNSPWVKIGYFSEKSSSSLPTHGFMKKLIITNK